MHRSKLVLALLAALVCALVAGSPVTAQTLTTLHSFSGEPDGADPGSDLIQIGSTLYGATGAGGMGDGIGGNGWGTVYSIPVTGGNPTILTAFTGNNGGNPVGNLTLVGSNLYGVTYQGSGSDDYGTIYSVPVAGGTPTVLYAFTYLNSGGYAPAGGLTVSGDGTTFYGTTASGGANGDGTVYSIPVDGGAPTTLASLNAASGETPRGSLTLVGSTLYGTTISGGAHGDGTIFSVPVTGGAITTLASFNGTNGSEPYNGLTLVGSTLYGMTNQGGANSDGTIFSIPVGGGTLTTLGSLSSTTGMHTYGDLTVSGSALYGTTLQGGPHGDGTIFSIPLAGGPITTLFGFSGPNGASPVSGVTVSGSTLYGTTSQGGANLIEGTVYALQLVPEPSSVVLLGLGGISLGAIAMRRRMRTTVR